jgi:hypothetical protein
MPTTRPRYVITETDEVARALDDAALEWPEISDSRTKLLLRLIAAGRAVLAEGAQQRADRRAGAIRATAGALDGVYPVGYLEELRKDWPE